MKKRYDVQFWYHTDLRSNEEVEASDDVAALVLAIDRSPHQYRDWVQHGDGFYIKITRL